MKRDPLSIKGAAVVDWVALDPGVRRRLLVGLEWVDDHAEWLIEDIDDQWILLLQSTGARTQLLRLGDLSSGECYADPDSLFASTWLQSRSPREIRLREALEYFQAHQVPIGERFPTDAALGIHEALSVAPVRADMPDPGHRDALYEHLKDVDDRDVLRWAARLFASWLQVLTNPPPFDGEATLRIQTAYLARHSGLLELAMDMTRVVYEGLGDFQRTDEQDSILCVERAAVMLDLLDKGMAPEPEASWLQRVERLLKSAWRRNPGSMYVRAVYRRFDQYGRSPGH